MVQRLRGKQAVYLVTPPDGWKPQRLWDWPPTFLTGQLVARNLRPANAAGYCRTHNTERMAALQRGEPVGTWAIYCRHLRPHWRKRPGQEPMAKGGVA